MFDKIISIIKVWVICFAVYGVVASLFLFGVIPALHSLMLNAPYSLPPSGEYIRFAKAVLALASITTLTIWFVRWRGISG